MNKKNTNIVEATESTGWKEKIVTLSMRTLDDNREKQQQERIQSSQRIVKTFSLTQP